MTPQDVITQVRRLIQDNGTTLRYSDTILLGYVNQSLKRIIPFRPDLFVTTGVLSPTASTVSQTLSTSVHRLIEIYSVVGGSAIQEVNRETLDQMLPTWTTETAGTPLNWMRDPRNPRKYFLYPAPSSGITLNAEYVGVPTAYGLSDTITELPESYFGAVIDCTIFLAESTDNEHIGNGRAKFFYDSFMEAMSADFAQRAVTDAESGQVGAGGQQRGRGRQ